MPASLLPAWALIALIACCKRAVGALGEGGDADIADVAVRDVELDRIDLDVAAGQLHFEGLHPLARAW